MLVMNLFNDIAKFFWRFLIVISSGLYSIANSLIRVFLVLAKGTLISADQYKLLIENFYVVLGIVMLFFLAFTILKSMVSADEDKNSATTVRKIVINLVTSSIMLALLPTIFEFAFSFQSAVLRQNTIAGFFGFANGGASTDEVDDAEAIRIQANTIVNSIFAAFYEIQCESIAGSSISEAEKICQQNISSDDSYNIEGYGDQHYNFWDASTSVNSDGYFLRYTHYAQPLVDGKANYHFLMSVVAGAILIYVFLSYCIDMAKRLIKLVFYQLIAPIPIFARVVPEGKMNSLFKDWLKCVLTCYAEVFIRVALLYFVMYICNAMLHSTTGFFESAYKIDWFTGLLTKAFTFMGLILFMKEAPKLISQMTGIDSGSMSMGLKDKLKDSGLFTAGAIAGGAITGGVRNAVSAFGKKENWQNKNGKATFGSVMKNLGRGLGSAAAGTTSGARRGFSAGRGAGSFSDMRNAASTAAEGATEARVARDQRQERYKATGGNWFTRSAVGGIIMDRVRSAGEWAGIGTSQKLDYFSKAADTTNQINSMMEGTYKQKQEFIDQSSKVKALKAKLGASAVADYDKLNKEFYNLDTSTAEGAAREKEILQYFREHDSEIQEYLATQKEYNAEKAVLDKMQIDISLPKRDIIATAATKLAVDVKTNFANDSSMQQSYQRAIADGFGLSSNIKDFNIDASTGNITFTDSAGATQSLELKQEDKNVIKALMNGQAVSDKDINADNIAKIQAVADKANIGRQHMKAEQERAEIVKNGQKPSSGNDKK